ncbi:MAG TPA: hypothetical protein VFI31_27595 [Pirellulales bacterium]|nr:hypothetical protein [Pirellulales bacterium]
MSALALNASREFFASGQPLSTMVYPYGSPEVAELARLWLVEGSP